MLPTLGLCPLASWANNSGFFLYIVSQHQILNISSTRGKDLHKFGNYFIIFTFWKYLICLNDIYEIALINENTDNHFGNTKG